MHCHTLGALVNAACLPAGSVHSVVRIDNWKSQLCNECPLFCHITHCEVATAAVVYCYAWLFVLTSIVTTWLDCNMCTHAMLTSRNLVLLNSWKALLLEKNAVASTASLLGLASGGRKLVANIHPTANTAFWTSRLVSRNREWTDPCEDQNLQLRAGLPDALRIITHNSRTVAVFTIQSVAGRLWAVSRGLPLLSLRKHKFLLGAHLGTAVLNTKYYLGYLAKVFWCPCLNLHHKWGERSRSGSSFHSSCKGLNAAASSPRDVILSLPCNPMLCI